MLKQKGGRKKSPRLYLIRSSVAPYFFNANIPGPTFFTPGIV
jgi:hypothetical protein